MSLKWDKSLFTLSRQVSVSKRFSGNNNESKSLFHTL